MPKGGFSTHKAIRLPGSAEHVSDLAFRLQIAWDEAFADTDPAYRAILFQQNINAVVKSATIEFNRRFSSPEPKRVVE